MSTAPAPLWHEHADAELWARAAATQIAQCLRADLQKAPRVLLLLSGGSTPEPVYLALAAEDLPWSRVVISLVDERFVPPDSAGSNAGLLGRVFAHGPAAQATRWPLVSERLDLAQCVAAANARLDDADLHLSVVVFGMGEDGHCASLFPGAADLPAALASARSFTAFDARGCKVAEPYPQRLTLTPIGWREASCRLLLIAGARKRAVFERALTTADPLQSPVVAAIREGGAALQVHWYSQERQK